MARNWINKINRMNRTLYLATLMFFVLSNLFGQADDNNINRSLYKKNKIKSIKIYDYKYKNGKANGKGKLLFYYLYDTTGLLTESYFYGAGEYHQQYKYNEKDNLSEDIGYFANSPFSTTYKYKYDSNGKITEKAKSIDGDSWYYTYDSLGNQIKIKWLYLGATQPNSYFTDNFEFNDKNKMTKMTRYNSDNTVYFYKTFDYNITGNLIKEIRFEKGDTTDIDTYRYDTKGNQIETQTLDKHQNRITCWSKINYDDKGLIVDEIGQLSFEDKGYYRKYVYE